MSGSKDHQESKAVEEEGLAYMFRGEFAPAALTKSLRVGSFNSRHFFSHSPGGQNPKNKVQAGLGSPEASVLGLQMTVFSLHPLCAHIPGVSSSP